MVATTIDSEQWYADYEAASAKQQYDMLLEIMAHLLSPELIEDLDLGLLLVMMRDELVNHNQLEQAVRLIRTLQSQQPALHQQEFPFLDNLLVEYYLYRDEPEQVRSALQLFMQHPAEDVDQTLAILDYLKFYNATALAIELSRAAYQPVKASPNVVLGTEKEFGQVLLHNQIQQVYQKLQQGESVDWDTFSVETAQYGFEKRQQKWVTELQSHLTTLLAETPEFLARFKRDRDEALRAVSIAFSQFMLEQKQMSFICSQAVWQAIADFLESRDVPRKKLSQPELYFTFTQDQLDRYITRKIDGMLSLEQSVGIAALWGIPYLYEFLLAKQIIPESLYQQAIDITNALKTILMDGYPKLWKFDFVHRWLPPGHISPQDFAAETERFAASLEPVTDLSDEPGKGITHQNFIDGLKQQLPPDLVESIESMEFEEEEEEEDEEEKMIGSSWLNSLHNSSYTIKPDKPRKSALQLAAELPEGEKRSTGKRKKRKR